METDKIADILLNMSLDMDYADMIEYYDEIVKELTREIDELGEDSSLLNALEMIAMENEDMYRLAVSR